MEVFLICIVTTSIIYLYFKGKRVPDHVDSKSTQTETLLRIHDVNSQGTQTEVFPGSPSVMSESSSSNFLGLDIEMVSDIDSFFYTD